MLLAIDIGNTNITLGLYDGEEHSGRAGGWPRFTTACPMNTVCSSWAYWRMPGADRMTCQGSAWPRLCPR